MMRVCSAAGVNDLVLDLRYNGGGLVGISSQLAYMIAGPARTQRFHETSSTTSYRLNLRQQLRRCDHAVLYGDTGTFGRAGQTLKRR